MSQYFSKRNLFSSVVSIVLSLALVASVTFAATTISTDINTGGTLTVTGASTLTGAVTASGAVTVAGVTIFNGQMQASSTALVSALTLGSATPANSLSGTILFQSRTSDPTGVTQGTFYYNSTNKTLKMFDGTNWFTVGTTTSGLTLSAPRIQLSDLTTQYLTLGTTTQQSLSTLTVEATSTESIPLTLVGYNSQTTHLFDVVNPGGTKLFYLNSGGGIFGSSTAQFTGAVMAYGNATTTLNQYVGLGLTVAGMATTSSAGNISTQGTLTVTGATLLNGAVTVGDAAADVIVITGNASTTNAFTVGTTLYVGGNATTTGSTGNFGTLGKIGAGTTTPTTLELSAQGSATTTIGAFSSGSAVGSCLQLQATNGTLYRMYISATDNVSTTTNGHTGQLAIWEVGSCK